MPTPSLSTITVFDYEMKTGDPTLANPQPVVGAEIRCVLNYNQSSSVSTAANLEPVQIATTTDATGYWQFNLVPNTNINPANTTYQIVTPSQRYDIAVPASGPVQSSSIKVGAPVALAPTASNVGALTVNGAFTVNTGPVSLPAGSVSVATLSGILPIANGGTGSATKNFVDLTTAQTVAGGKTFSSALTASAGATISSGATVNGGATLNGGIQVPTSLLVGATGSPTSGFIVDLRGNVRNTTAYKFRAFNTGAQSLTTAAQKISFPSESYDPNGNFDSVTNYRYTAPVAGFYMAGGAVALTSAPRQYVSLYVNSAETYRLTDAQVGGTAGGVGGSTVIQLNVNDFVELWSFVGTAATTQPGSAFVYFFAHYLSS